MNVLARRARRKQNQTTGQLMLPQSLMERYTYVYLSDWLSSCWSSYSDQTEVNKMVGMDVPCFCLFFFRLVLLQRTLRWMRWISLELCLGDGWWVL